MFHATTAGGMRDGEADDAVAVETACFVCIRKRPGILQLFMTLSNATFRTVGAEPWRESLIRAILGRAGSFEMRFIFGARPHDYFTRGRNL